MLKLFAKYLKPYTGGVLAVVLMTILTSTSSLVLPMLSKPIIDQGAIAGNQAVAVRYMAIMLAVAVVSVLVAVLCAHISSGVSMGFSRDVRKALFSHVCTLSQGDIESIGTSSLISRQTNDIMQLQTVLIQILQSFLTAPLLFFGGIIVALLTVPRLCWMLAVILPVAVVIMVVFMLRSMNIFKTMQTKLDTVNRLVREALNGMRVIRAFNREEFEERHFDGANRDLKFWSQKGQLVIFILMPVTTALVNAVNLLLIWFGAHYMDAGSVSYGDVQAFAQYVSMILTAFTICSVMMIILPRGQISARRINEVLEKEPSVTSPQAAERVSGGEEASLAFSHVSFSFPGAEKPVLSDISFSAKKGETIAIIGGTGSGKSTLLNLISRHYDVTEGSVCVDGVDIRNLSLEDLNAHLAIVPQKAFLFSGTILDNMRFGKTDATLDEVMHAIDVSQSREFVDGKKDGVNTAVSQGGTNFSGGQRQRLAIARALVKKADVYLFDDSFSALDFKTDAALRKMLKPEVRNAVTVIVAQRVSTIQDADKILVLDAGKLVGSGTHEELLQTCAVYREIAQSQTADKEEKSA